MNPILPPWEKKIVPGRAGGTTGGNIDHHAPGQMKRERVKSVGGWLRCDGLHASVGLLSCADHAPRGDPPDGARKEFDDRLLRVGLNSMS